MKKRVLSMLLVSILLITQVTVLAKDYSDYPQRFWDVPKDHWAFEYISELVDKNVLSGYEDGSYRPEETVTRAEWSKMMVVASGKQEVKLNNNGSYAVDYNSNDWYYGYINAVVDYMNFYNESDGTYFKPNQAVSREDVTVSLVKLKGYDTDNVDYSVVMKFKDNASISNSIKKYVAVGIEKGLISGYEDNTFRGQDTLTRAEAATLLCRAFQMGNDNKTNNNPDVVNPDENNNSNSNTSNDTQNDVNNNGNGNTNVNNNDENKADKKEYKVETLAKANLPSNSLYMTIANDDFYYVDEKTNDIMKVNMIDGNTETIINVNNISIEYDGIEYENIKLKNIFYDFYIDSLVVAGSFDTNNDFFENESEDFSCLIELNTMNVIHFENAFWWYEGDVNTKTYQSIDDFTFVNGLDSGPYVVYHTTHNWAGEHTSSSLMNRNEYNHIGNGVSGIIKSFNQEYNGKIYYLNIFDGLSQGALEYKDLTNGTNDKVSNLSFCGLSNNKVVNLSNDMINIYSLDGKKELSINTNDIKLSDNQDCNINRMRYVFVGSNGNLLFYDSYINSFRMISKND